MNARNEYVNSPVCCHFRNMTHIRQTSLDVFPRAPSATRHEPLLSLPYLTISNLKPRRPPPTTRLFYSTSTSPSPSQSQSPSSASSFNNQSYYWGVVREFKAPSITRDEVLAFLKSQGISSQELDSIELPLSLEVLEERLDFLCKVGVEKEHVNEYPRVLCCSVKKNMIPVINYLEKLGFTSSTLPFLLRKYPMILHTSVVVDLQPLIDYLLGFGIERKDIPKVLLKYPDVLGFKLEGTMSTSVAYLISIGVGIRAIAPMLVEFPQILGMRVGNNIKPKVELICSLGLSKEAVARLLEKHPYLLGLGLEDCFKPAIAALVRAGVREQALPMVIAQFPSVLGIDIEQKLAEKYDWLTKQLKVQPEEVGRILEKLPQIIVINEAMAMERVGFLSSTGGFKENEIAQMVASCPQILALSIEDALIPNLSFFNKEMKRPLQDIVDFPAFFTYNLEDRIGPRFRQIRQKGIKCSLSWFLNCSDAKFHERLSMDYMENPLPGRLKLSFVSEEALQSRSQALQDEGADIKANVEDDSERGSFDSYEGTSESEEWSESDGEDEDWLEVYDNNEVKE